MVCYVDSRTGHFEAGKLLLALVIDDSDFNRLCWFSPPHSLQTLVHPSMPGHHPTRKRAGEMSFGIPISSIITVPLKLSRGGRDGYSLSAHRTKIRCEPHFPEPYCITCTTSRPQNLCGFFMT